MSKKTEAHPHFRYVHGSLFCTETGSDGSLFGSGATLKNGGILYILGGCSKETSTKLRTGDSCEVLPFPISRQHERVIDVATKLGKLKTRRHGAYYRQQVSDALEGRLTRQGIPTDRRHREIARFWIAVHHASLLIDHDTVDAAAHD